MPCKKELEELRKSKEELWNLGINPKKAFADLRTLAALGELTEKQVAAYVRYKKAKFDLVRCAFDYVLGYE